MQDTQNADVNSIAAEFLVRLHAENLTREDRVAYVRWLKESPRHVTAMLQMGNILDQLRKVPLDVFLSAGGTDRTVPLPLPAILPPAEFVPTEHWLRASIVTQVRDAECGSIIVADPAQFIDLVLDLERDPRLMHELHWRKWEEIVAAAYDRQGFEVILTPRSGDGGRDVIATRRDVGAIRIFDQVKAFRADRLVTADDVFSMLGVLVADANVSKAFVTTTADFAPGVYKDARLTRFMPYRLELRPRSSLLQWLSQVKNHLGLD